MSHIRLLVIALFSPATLCLSRGLGVWQVLTDAGSLELNSCAYSCRLAGLPDALATQTISTMHITK